MNTRQTVTSTPRCEISTSQSLPNLTKEMVAVATMARGTCEVAYDLDGTVRLVEDL